MRARTLLTDRFVCVVRKGQPVLRKRFTLTQFVAGMHLQVAPRGRPGGYLDAVLRERGLTRTVVRAVPYFHAALQLAAETDYLLTVSERVARRFAGALSLTVLEVPLPLRPYALSLVWHPRLDADEGHRFMRDVWVRAAQQAAGERHEAPRTRLDASDPTSGQTRKRPRRVR
jgi:DNA-binding transcriptional LysR family regulator